MTRILIKRGTSTQWTSSSTPLYAGELGLDTTNNILKVGNGNDLWSTLAGVTLTASQVNELAQDAVALALDHADHSNIVVTYNDSDNKIVLSTAANVVTSTSLNNTLTDSVNGYVPISDVGGQDGVAPLDSNALIPDMYIPSSITRDSELSSHSTTTTNIHGISNTANLVTLSGSQSITNKTIGDTGLAFNSGGNNSSIYTEGNDMSVYANSTLYLNANTNVIIQPANGYYASVRGDVLATLNASQTLANKTLSSPTFTGTPIAPTASAGTNTTQIATTAFVSTALANLVASAPSTLDTLNELAVALGNDANFSTTITNSLGLKLNSTTAASTYLTISDASSTYLTQSNASSTYLTQSNASSTYLTQSNASSTYLTQSNASSTYAPIASPTFTGTISGITKTMVGLGNVDNTSDTNKPVSTATQSAIDSNNLNSYIASSSTSITLSSSSHKFKVLEVNSSSPISIIIPNDTQDSGWPIGSYVEVRQVGSGQVTVNKDAAVTYYATDSQFKTRVQWSSLFIEKRAANSWLVSGDSTA